MSERPNTGDGACFAATRALCNVCGRLTEAKITFRDARVWLVKWCPDHGTTRALVSSDLEWYRRSLGYVKPGTLPLARAVGHHGVCPESCGLCPAHQQHTCVPLLEITSTCNLDCPVCLVGTTPPDHLAVSDVERIVGHLVRYEGTLNMLTLSGGEPTTHPELLEILDVVCRPEIGIVSVSTNGVELARDDTLLRELVDRGVVIALQFDGLVPATYERLRGDGELAALKRRLIDRILALGGQVSLTVTLAKGVNEHELPGILQLLFTHDEIPSVMVQPLALTDRARQRHSADYEDVLTIPDVVKLLAASSGGVLKAEDFSPLPCSHPTCFALTYLLKTDTGLVSLPSLVDPDAYLDIIKNQALLNTDYDTLQKVKDALYGLWSSGGLVPNRDVVLRAVKQLLLDLNELGPSAPHRDVLRVGAERVKSIFIHHFMDRGTFDLSRAMKCCNHYPQVDGRLLPACVRNNIPLER
ncbi:MAG: radical SAM protein [bacterium]